MDVGEGIAGETAIKLMHKEIGICSRRYRVQTRKCVFMDKIRLWHIRQLDVGDGIAGETVTKLTHDERGILRRYGLEKNMCI
jgi:hypothetical protein